MNKRNIGVIICICVILGLLAIILAMSPKSPQDPPEPDVVGSSDDVLIRAHNNWTLFNTSSVIYSYAGDSSDDFGANCGEVWSILAEYHQLFDIYYEYSGINNLCTLNKNAGGEALEVSPKLIEFLLYAKECYTLTNGETNVMMGAVLVLWHDAREAKNYVPDEQTLLEASKHTSIDCLEIDAVNNTVRITDKDARIDVGALGKGYATEMAARYLENKGISSYVLSIGGNIRLVGTKTNGDGWDNVRIKNPKNTSTFVKTLCLSDTSCVTSGDYERYYNFNGTKYHHIIDKDTLVPANYFSSVTIITKDSGLADALSTALFCMSYEEGLALVESIGGVEVLWIYTDGTIKTTDGFDALEVK